MEDIVVKAEVGDKVVAKKDYTFLGEAIIKEGDTWTVTDKYGMFVAVEKEDDGNWLGDNIFVDVFEGGE